MSYSNSPESHRDYIEYCGQRMYIGGQARVVNQQQMSMSQLTPPAFMGMSQPPVQPGFPGYGSHPAGFFANQQQYSFAQGRPQPTNSTYRQGGWQPAYAPGVGAINRLPNGFWPSQPQHFPQAQACMGQYGQNVFPTSAQNHFVGKYPVNSFPVPYQQVQQQQQQYGQRAFKTPAPNQLVPQNGVNYFPGHYQAVQLHQVQQRLQQSDVVATDSTPSAPSSGNTPAPAPSTPASSLTPPGPKTVSPVEAANLRARVAHLKVSIHEGLYPCAFRLLRSFECLNVEQRRKYCTLFWPSNEAALEDMLEMAKLSPCFMDIYFHRAWCHSADAEPMTKQGRDDHDQKVLDAVVKMKTTCKTRLQDIIDDEKLGQLGHTVNNVKGKKRKAAVAAQEAGWKEEAERLQQEKQKRCEAIGMPPPTQLAGQKRKERIAGGEEPAPAPKKRGRPPKIMPAEEEGVVKEKKKKKRGRPKKVPVAQVPPPGYIAAAASAAVPAPAPAAAAAAAAEDEYEGVMREQLLAGIARMDEQVEESGAVGEDDGSFEAEMFAAFGVESEVVEENVGGFADDNATPADNGEGLEPSYQLQGQEQYTGAAAPITEDLPAASSEKPSAPESDAEVDRLPPLSEQVEEGRVEEGRFDPIADGAAMDELFGGYDSKFDYLFKDDDDVEVDVQPEEIDDLFKDLEDKKADVQPQEPAADDDDSRYDYLFKDSDDVEVDAHPQEPTNEDAVDIFADFEDFLVTLTMDKEDGSWKTDTFLFPEGVEFDFT